MQKYKLTSNTKTVLGTKVYQVQALRNIERHGVKKGDLGGWVESEDNLSQDGDAWVYDNALVYGNALVFGNAKVYGTAEVYGNARVFGNANVSGDAIVSGDVWVSVDCDKQTFLVEPKSPTINVDMKAGLGKKPQVGYVSPAAEIYTARAHQYGADKYQIGNYLREPPEGTSDLERLWGYADAMKRHCTALCDSIIRFIGKGRGAAKTEKEAAYAADLESKLPHLAHMGATYSIMVQQAVDAGLLPEDPGTPWKVVK